MPCDIILYYNIKAQKKEKIHETRYRRTPQRRQKYAFQRAHKGRRGGGKLRFLHHRPERRCRCRARQAPAEIYHPEKYTPATIEFVDIAGLVKGASQGEGLGNKFLSHIREVDAILHVVRCFENPDVIHVENSVDPVRDVDTINTELILADVEVLERRIDRVKKQMKGDSSLARELEVLEKVNSALNEGKCAREVELEPDEAAFLKDATLLTAKPVIYVANVAEDDLKRPARENKYYAALEDRAKAEGAGIIAVSAQIEAELAELADDEREMYLADMFEGMGLEDTGLSKLIRESYSLLGLISFLTAGPKEVRAWTIKKGTKAPQAAGKIHTDFERGFIKAEVVNYQDLLDNGSLSAAKEKGIVGMEGKEYVVKDGDVILFRFNV